MGISLSVHYLNNQHPSKIRHSISRSMYHSSLEEITKIVTLEKTNNYHSEMAFNLKWSVIFTLAMVGQLLHFGSAMPQSTGSLTPEMLERAFERLDENGNNFISKREFFLGVESLNEDTNDPNELSRNTVNVLFIDLDKNNDGKLDFEEFKKLGSLSGRRFWVWVLGLVGKLVVAGSFASFAG